MIATLESLGFPRQSPQQSRLFGAGRSIDVIWPGESSWTGAGPSLGLEGWNSSRTSTRYAWAFVQDAGSTDAFESYLQTPAVAMTSATAAGNLGLLLSNNDVTALRTIIQKGHSVVPSCNDYHVQRYAMIAAFTDIPAIDADFGIELVFPATGSPLVAVIRNSIPGFGWTLRPTGVPNFLVNTAGGATQFFPIAIPNFDITQFHLYEFRVTCATQTQEATVKAYIDDQLQFTFPWGAGTILPAYNAAYMQANCVIAAMAGTNHKFHLQQFRYMASQLDFGLML